MGLEQTPDLLWFRNEYNLLFTWYVLSLSFPPYLSNMTVDKAPSCNKLPHDL